MEANGDRFGYDLKSLRQDFGDKMLIEVKSSKSKFSDAKMYITRNEYKTMLQNIQNYVLYLWWEVKQDVGEGPYLVEGSQLAEKLSCLKTHGIDFSDSLVVPFTILVNIQNE